MQLSAQQVTDFQSTVMDFYHEHGRHALPWRQPEADGSFNPYKILVSELMLQQTQVARVIPKFNKFLELFPSVEELAESSLAAVLTAWSGLGYNRRAKFLHEAANYVVHDYEGIFPNSIEALIKLPGVGKNTAGAILAYTFNQPVVFVETNIRTVYLQHFFQGREAVTDSEITEVVRQTLPLKEGKRAARAAEFISAPGAMRKKGSPENAEHFVGQSTVGLSYYREWYWALMDYGAYLKSTGIKLNTLSKHYTKQSKFEGSKRQIRGKIIRILTAQDQNGSTLAQLVPDSRLLEVLNDLVSEGLITKTRTKYHLSK